MNGAMDAGCMRIKKAADVNLGFARKRFKKWRRGEESPWEESANDMAAAAR